MRVGFQKNEEKKANRLAFSLASLAIGLGLLPYLGNRQQIFVMWICLVPMTYAAYYNLNGVKTLIKVSSNEHGHIQLSKRSSPHHLFALNPAKLGLALTLAYFRRNFEIEKTADINLPMALLMGTTTICSIIGLGLASRYVVFDPKLPSLAYGFLWTINQVSVCFSEELMFRAYIGSLIKRSLSSQSGLVVPMTAVLFGLYHVDCKKPKRSIAFATLSTIAGVGYHSTYCYGGLKGSIWAHFGLNATHLLGYSYPRAHHPLMTKAEKP